MFSIRIVLTVISKMHEAIAFEASMFGTFLQAWNAFDAFM